MTCKVLIYRGKRLVELAFSHIKSDRVKASVT